MIFLVNVPAIPKLYEIRKIRTTKIIFPLYVMPKSVPPNPLSLVSITAFVKVRLALTEVAIYA